MTDSDRQLVELITQQVLALLQQGGGSRTPGATGALASAAGAPAAATSPVPHTAPIHPPIGQCTGDYSKFPELAGKLYGNASPASLAVAAAALKSAKAKGGGQADGGDAMIANRSVNVRTPSGSAPLATPRAITATSNFQPPSAQHSLPLTGIITANQLQEAAKASPDGTVLLAMDAKLTPLANDWARQKKDKIRRVSPQDVGSLVKPAHSAGGAAATSPWLWWIEGGCPIVRDVTQAFGLALRPIAAAPTGGSLPQVLRELARAVKAKQVAGGILFVPSASKAVCMANRCQSLRAIVGTCGEAIEQGLAEIGANVLIIEYPHHGHRSTTAMLDRFTQQLPVVPASVERMLVDMQRCV